MPLGMEVGLSPGVFELDGDSAPSPQKDAALPNFRPTSIVAKRLMGTRLPSHKGAQPQFSASARCGQTAGWTKMPLGMEVGLHPGDFVFNGDPATPRKRAHPPHTQFLAHVCCGQMAGWIKMPLDTEVNIGSGEVVLDGVAAAP